jgi:hypothetical protein
MSDATSDLQELSNFRIIFLKSFTVRNVIHTYEEVAMSRVTDLLLPYYNENNKETATYIKVTGLNWPRGWIEVQLHPFLTSALEGVGGQHHAPAALPPGKTRYPLYRRLDGSYDRSGPVR